MSTKIKPNEAVAAYGSLYMQKGELFLKACQQVERVSKKKPALWFFDVVCSPKQVPSAHRMAQSITDFIHETCPDLAKENIIVGVTTKDSDRPAWQLMQAFAQEMNGMVTEVLAIKQGRRYAYIGGRLQS